MSRVSEQTLIAAMAMADDGGGEPFELVPAAEGRPAFVIDVRPAQPGEYLVYCIRRIKGERARYLESTKAGIELGRAEAKAKEEADAGIPAKPLTAKQVAAELAKAEDDAAAALIDQVNVQIDSGPESMAALAAICIGHPGNETIERRLIRSPRLLELHAVAARLTFSQPNFHDAVSAYVWGPKAATEAKATGSDSSAQS
ncbi:MULTISPECIES: hypothetical protein [unclassified Methylobacterium]|uniref:hypothetical protein n=1 Tax=unclassified Methylobacterium TaxID=2615210 RepID=UPI000CAF2243|nr:MULTISPECIES: hypothetical protein [unclassified Methylobacterium]PIU06634.1 MAG: hypothetical protein COT56_08875 [Methylobacterium sp. CG09_land_8_20_14_0_10_71_15]PIU11334.1 MAG: hypothetical protein COT28_20580 [Methylobacterium sp. CG08_land_8_20_14_0_20_71_15]GBU19014.1 hypothetical protein AwMethylo_32290 [Methylobacterium sp.]